MKDGTEDKNDLVIPMRRPGRFKAWALFLNAHKSPRMGVGVRQENAMGVSTVYSWLSRDQVERLHKWTRAWLRTHPRRKRP